MGARPFSGPVERTPDTLPGLAEGAGVALTGWGTPPITAELLARRPALTFVSHSAGSVRRLVPGEAIESGRLKVSHVAIHIAEAVAEFVLAQTLSILREPHLHDAGMKAGKPWFELRERHLGRLRSEEHTSELQSLMRTSYAVFCLKKKKT